MQALVTRPVRDGEKTAARLAARGHIAHLAPVVEIVATEARRRDAPIDGVIATSAHALMLLNDPDFGALQALPVHLVGERTRQAAQARGFTNVRQAHTNSRELTSALIASVNPQGRYLYLAGRDRKPELERALKQAGHQVETHVVYEARACTNWPEAAVDALRCNAIDAVLHYSRRSGGIFLQLVAALKIDPLTNRAAHICISSDAARPLVRAGLRVKVATTADEAAMFETLESLSGQARRLPQPRPR